LNEEHEKHVPVPKNDEVFIAKSLKGKKRRQVIAHEVHEAELMKRGMKYKPAHKKSLRYENRIK
jgi:hypothetical protein